MKLTLFKVKDTIVNEGLALGKFVLLFIFVCVWCI